MELLSCSKDETHFHLSQLYTKLSCLKLWSSSETQPKALKKILKCGVHSTDTEGKNVDRDKKRQKRGSRSKDQVQRLLDNLCTICSAAALLVLLLKKSLQ